jgi:3-oxoacyl-[acyl-carrier-protein] synthase II
VGLVTPIGQSADEVWTSLVEGRSGARPVRSFDTTTLPNHVGREIEGFEVPGELAGSVLGGRCTGLALAAAAQAARGAGIEGILEGSRDFAVVVGTTMGDVTQFERDRATHPDRETDDDDVSTLANRPLDIMGRSIARHYAMSGPILTVPAACAAGTLRSVSRDARRSRRGPRRLAVGCEAFRGWPSSDSHGCTRCRRTSAGRSASAGPDCCSEKERARS